MPEKAGDNAKEKQELMVLKDQHSWLKKQNSSKENGKVKPPINGARKTRLSRKRKVFRSLFLNLEAKAILRTGKPVLNSVTSVPAPGRKLFTVIVRPGAGKGASITLRINGWTRAGDISRLFSTSSKICKEINQTLVHHTLVSQKKYKPMLCPIP